MIRTKIPAAAIKGLTAEGFEDEPGFCSRFVRQVVQSVAGHKYNSRFMPTAKQTGQEFKKHLFSREQALKLKMNLDNCDFWLKSSNPKDTCIGDILFRCENCDSDDPGHVCVRIAGNMVAENSVVHQPDGRGKRKVEDVKFDCIVRLNSIK